MDYSLSQFKGYIFDLDGVVVDTRPYHTMAWQQLATELDMEISHEAAEVLRALSRMEGVERIMEWGELYASEAEKMFWADRKNNWYLQFIANLTPNEVLPGVLDFLKKIKILGKSTVLVSSSANARKVLESTGLESYFSAVIDGNISKKSKPAPDCFLLAAESIGLTPEECVVFEDAPVGVLAAKRGGFATVAVGAHRAICDADYCLDGFKSLNTTIFNSTQLIHSESE